MHTRTHTHTHTHTQLDLKEEAKNLWRFHRLLHYYSKVKFPTPIQPYVTNTVLVESFEVNSNVI